MGAFRINVNWSLIRWKCKHSPSKARLRNIPLIFIYVFIFTKHAGIPEKFFFFFLTFSQFTVFQLLSRIGPCRFAVRKTRPCYLAAHRFFHTSGTSWVCAAWVWQFLHGTFSTTLQEKKKKNQNIIKTETCESNSRNKWKSPNGWKFLWEVQRWAHNSWTSILITILTAPQVPNAISIVNVTVN